jgi:hypothetical protein
MIATTGDEVFVMLAMFPKEAKLLTVILFVVGMVAGWLVGCTVLQQLACCGIQVCQIEAYQRERRPIVGGG